MERFGHYSGEEKNTYKEVEDVGLLTCLQSLGWEHYEVHEPEPHILLFK